MEKFAAQEYREDAKKFVKKCLSHTSQQRQMTKINDPNADQSVGIFLGRYVLHPITGEKLPVYSAVYVIGDYATGAVMGVPAHDKRDNEFAITMKMPASALRPVLEPVDEAAIQTLDKEKNLFTGYGKLKNSSFKDLTLDGMNTKEAINFIGQYAKDHQFGVPTLCQT